MPYRIFFKFCTLFFLLETLTVSTVHAQEQKSYSISESGNGSFYAHIRPFSVLFGVAGGVEYQLRKKISLVTNLEGQFWGLPSQIAISPIVKYYFTGCVANGFYGRLKLISGMFFYPSAIAEQPYYGGGGLGVGWMYRLRRSSSWHFCVDTGLLMVRPFGKVHSTSQSVDSNEYYMTVFFSSGSPVDLSFSFAYSF